MSKRDVDYVRKGKPAFPVSFGPDGTPGYDDGMSLRDWFAGQALVYLGANSVAHEARWAREFGDGWENSSLPEIATDAYRLADAMLAAREAE